MNATRITSVTLALAPLAFTAFTAGVSVGEAHNVDTRVYELRTYTTNAGRMPALQKRFAEHTMRLFEKHGMQKSPERTFMTATPWSPVVQVAR